MAGLQMAPHPYPDTMPSYEKMAASKFPSLGQERHAAPAPKHQSRLELMRSQFHDQLLREREKEMKMVNMFNQKQQSALSKARSNSYHHPPSVQPEPQPTPGRQGFLSAGYSSSYKKPDLGSQTTASTWTAKKSSGVDRAYPLKPVFHRKAVTLNIIAPAEETRGQQQRPFLPAAHPNSKARTDTEHAEGSSTFSPGLLELQKRSRSNPGREEQPWQKLEAVGDNMEEEIRKKEAVLREKLRRTEEELRRIQREKEYAEQEERTEREGRERRRRAEMDRNTRTAPLKPGNGFKNAVMGEDSSDEDDDEEEYAEINMTRRNTNSRGDRSWMNSTVSPSYRPSPQLGTQDHGVDRLKKERLVASNNKIRSRDPLPPSDQEPSNTSYHSNGSYRHRESPPSGSGSYVSPSFRDPDQRSNHRHSASSVKQPTAPISSAAPSGPSKEEEEADYELVPCHLCGRRFLAERLEKHATACRKMQSSKRKLFDSSKARAKGTDLEPYLNQKKKTTPAQEQQQTQPKKSTWRQKHESFIRNIRQAREVQQIIAKGGKLTDLPPLPPDENPDYICCQHCNRRFAPKVAERHIPKCETIKSKPRPPPQQRR